MKKIFFAIIAVFVGLLLSTGCGKKALTIRPPRQPSLPSPSFPKARRTFIGRR
jgi:hypothetical protein